MLLSLQAGSIRTVNIHEARTQLSRLVEQAANGEPFIIAKTVKCLGFLEGEFTVPNDFDTMFAAEIEQMFYGET